MPKRHVTDMKSFPVTFTFEGEAIVTVLAKSRKDAKNRVAHSVYFLDGAVDDSVDDINTQDIDVTVF